MSSQRYPEEFKTEAVKQILDHGHSVADVSSRLGVSTHSLYKWVRERQMPLAARTQQLSQSDELRRLKNVSARQTHVDRRWRSWLMIRCWQVASDAAAVLRSGWPCAWAAGSAHP